WQEPLQRVRNSLRFEPKRTGPRFVRDAPFAIYYVETIGPAGVVALGRVFEANPHSGNVNPQFHTKELPHLATLVDIFRAREIFVVVKIVGILPHVAGVR